jgi:TonB-linked SusC/RagA family outer membrane protein
MNSGSPSAATSIRIRGANSLSKNEPLYVIDGIQISGQAEGGAIGFNWAGGGNGQTAINPLAGINPADIVSIEVLKDASSTAIYGASAANGVILVTTKKGKAGKATIEYSANYGVQTPSKTLDVMNLHQYAQYQNDLADAGYISKRLEFSDLSLVPEGGTNWQKELFRSAGSAEHNVSISGGTDKLKFHVSGGYRQQDGMVIGSDFERFSGRINLEGKANEWLDFGVTVMASRSKETQNLTDSDDGVITGALIQSPYQEVRSPLGGWSGPAEEDPVQGLNPVAKALEMSNKIARNRLMANFWGEINLLDGLKYRAEFGSDLNGRNNYGFLPAYAWGTNINETAKSRRVVNTNTYWSAKNLLTYSKTLGSNDFSVMVGQEMGKWTWESLDGQRQGFVSNDIQELSVGSTDDQVATSSKGEGASVSFFGRAFYSYKSRYLLTATYRADGSSNFGPSNKWGYFPSFSIAWRASEEEFLKQFSFISNLKIRGGWGQVGNSNIPGYSYGASLSAVASKFGSAFKINNIPNPYVKWETTSQVNAGIDLSLFDNRIELVFDVYDKRTSDMLLQQIVPDYMGTLAGIGQSWMGLQMPQSNIAKMSNKGFDITLNTVNIDKNDFTWTTGLTFSRNKNLVTDMGLETAAIFRKVQWWDNVTKTTVGQPMGQFYGYMVDGIFQSVEEVQNSPTQKAINEKNGTWAGDIKFKDLNNDGKIDDSDRTFIGDPNPDFTYGISNTFSYKGIDLAISMNGVYGNEIFNFMRIRTEGMRDLASNQLNTVSTRWTPDNTNTSMPRLMGGDPNENARISDRFVEDGSFLRISSITLGYQIPAKYLSRTPITGLKVYAKAQNLYTFTNYSGYDPEVGAFNQDALLSGVDNGRYPMPRTFLVGLNLTF